MYEEQCIFPWRAPPRCTIPIQGPFDEILDLCNNLSSQGYHLLTKFLEHRQPQLAKKVLDRIPRIEAGTSRNHNTPLHIASAEGYLEIVKILLEKGSEINFPNEFEQRPLHFAAYDATNGPIVKVLLENGAAINEDNRRLTALHMASARGNTEIVSILIKHGAKTNLIDRCESCEGCKPIHLALSLGHTKIVELFFKLGAYGAREFEEDERMPLHAATQKGFRDMAEIFAKNHCNIDKTDEYGQSALHYASLFCQPDITEILLDYMPDVNLKNQDGQSPATTIEYKCMELMTNICFGNLNPASYLSLEQDMKSIHAIAGHINNHVVRLLAVGIHVIPNPKSGRATSVDDEDDTEHIVFIDGREYGFGRKLNDTYLACKEEFSQLESEFGHNFSITLKDILTGSAGSYVTNEALMNKLKSIDFEKVK